MTLSEPDDDLQPGEGLPSDKDSQRESFLKRLGLRLQRMLNRVRTFTDRHPLLRIFYKVLVATIGVLIILAGVAMLVLPGPGWLTIFFGLAILGTEFVWPRKILSWLRRQLSALKMRFNNYRHYRRDQKQQKQEQKQQK